jgi:hypothetical protein
MSDENRILGVKFGDFGAVRVFLQLVYPHPHVTQHKNF